MASSRTPSNRGDRSGAALVRLARADREAGRAALAELDFAAQAEALAELRPLARGELLALVETPEEVVPLLPEADLVHTVRATGMSEAAWLLELATTEQRLACFDLDCWTGTELAVDRVHEWIDALIEAGRPTLLRALEEVDLELLVLAVKNESSVVVCGKEDVPPEGFFTPDGVVYFGTQDDASPHRVHEITHALAGENPALYWRLVYGVLFETGTECEEEALRWRNARLLDLGFPEREHAMRVYRPLPLSNVPEWRSPVNDAPGLVEANALPRQLRGTLLGEALVRLPAGRALDLVGYVLGVANSLAVADGLPLSESESVPQAVEKAVRGIDRGLAELARSRNEPPEAVLDKTSPLDLFRVGATLDPSLRGPYR